MSNLYKFNQDTQIDEFGVDHSNFSLRDEIEYNTMRANQSMPKQQNPVRQIVGAVADITRNYFDMKRDNTVGADDYFHCKANYEAANHGPWGELTAQIVGDTKEGFDYLKNRFYKGFSYPDALSDYLHDKDVNLQGRQLSKNPLYSNSIEACQYQRVKDINEKY